MRSQRCGLWGCTLLLFSLDLLSSAQDVEARALAPKTPTSFFSKSSSSNAGVKMAEIVQLDGEGFFSDEGVGETFSDIYVNEYDNDIMLEWMIVTSPGTLASIELLAIDTEWGTDQLILKDGNNMQDFAAISGGSPISRIYRSNSNMLHVTFGSNDMVRGAGFYARHFATVGSPSTTIELETQDMIVFSDEGVGADFDYIYSNQYQNGTFKTWMLTSEEGTRATIQFLDFNTESTFDWVLVWDGEAMVPMVGHTGDDLPSIEFQSESNKIYLSFVSDSEISSFGFFAQFWGATAESETPDLVHLGPQEGYFSDEGLGEAYSDIATTQYGDNSDLEWLLTTPEGTQASIEFLDFSTEANFDYVTLRVGQTGEEIARLDGNSVAGNTYHSSTNEIHIHFTSDGGVSDYGFYARYFFEGSGPDPTSGPVAPAKVLQMQGGKVYVGPLSDENEMHGFGVLHFPNGDEFRGRFDHGSREGKGTLLVNRGKIKNMAGEMRDDKWNGWVAVRFRNGNKFTGKFVDGTSYGPGTFSYRNGTVVEGMFTNGVLRPRPAMDD